jgi:hypothetical protein
LKNCEFDSEAFIEITIRCQILDKPSSLAGGGNIEISGRQRYNKKVLKKGPTRMSVIPEVRELNSDVDLKEQLESKKHD